MAYFVLMCYGHSISPLTDFTYKYHLHLTCGLALGLHCKARFLHSSAAASDFQTTHLAPTSHHYDVSAAWLRLGLSVTVIVVLQVIEYWASTQRNMTVYRLASSRCVSITSSRDEMNRFHENQFAI